MVQKLKIGHSSASIRPKFLIGKKSRTDKHRNTNFKLFKELHKPYFSYEQLFVFHLADGTEGTPSPPSSSPPPPPPPQLPPSPPPEMSGHHVHFNRVPQVHYYYYHTDLHYDHDDDSVPEVQYYFVDDDDDDDDDDLENGQDNY